MSTAADPPGTHRSIHGGGAGARRRLHGVQQRATVAATITVLLLTACSQSGGSDRTAAAPGDAAPETAEAAAETAAAQACTTFWGDPDYRSPLSRDVLDRTATAPEAGPADPSFYALTADDVDAAFEPAPAGLQQVAGAVSTWLREEPARGSDADVEGMHAAITGLAEACAPASDAASWFGAPGPDGTKPAALVCADVFDTPSTFTHFANANVLTSNMFALVGRAPQNVPADRMDDVEATSELLDQQISGVDHDAVREALTQVRAPFADALEGDTSSDGLQQPLEQLGTACSAAGYDAGVGDAPGDGEQDDGSQGDQPDESEELV